MLVEGPRATITGSQADLNLGLTTLLDGATTTSIQLDTTTPGQHTIEYRAYDQQGLMGSATRTINVIPAPANNNLPLPLLSATTTAASSTAQ